MMLRHAILALALLAAVVPAAAAEVGRYQLVAGPPMVLLDTATGKTWRYEAPGKWVPLEIEQPKPAETATKEATQERWKREAEARRLQLKPSGPKPAEPTPSRKLLDKLLPKQQ